jgi:hypothetical protein
MFKICAILLYTICSTAQLQVQATPTNQGADGYEKISAHNAETVQKEIEGGGGSFSKELSELATEAGKLTTETYHSLQKNIVLGANKLYSYSEKKIPVLWESIKSTGEKTASYTAEKISAVYNELPSLWESTKKHGAELGKKIKSYTQASCKTSDEPFNGHKRSDENPGGEKLKIESLQNL